MKLVAKQEINVQANQSYIHGVALGEGENQAARRKRDEQILENQNLELVAALMGKFEVIKGNDLYYEDNDDLNPAIMRIQQLFDKI